MKIPASVLKKAKLIKLVVLDVDGVLTDGSLYAHEDKQDFSVGFYIQDGLGIKLLRKIGIETAIISGRKSAAVQKRMDQLGITHAFLGHEHKLECFEKLKDIFNVTYEQMAYAGDDWIDIAPMRKAGLKVTVPNAEAEVKAVADWETPRSGGQGAVRDLCELIIRAQGHYDTILKSYNQ